MPESIRLTEQEERRMDFISNTIIDLILASLKKDIDTKGPLPYLKKSNSFDVKGNVKT